MLNDKCSKPSCQTLARHCTPDRCARVELFCLDLDDDVDRFAVCLTIGLLSVFPFFLPRQNRGGNSNTPLLSQNETFTND